MDENQLALTFCENILPRKKAKLLFDVGAHYGNMAMLFAQKGWQVVAFEPEKDNFHHLQKNVKKYPTIRCEPLAVTNTTQPKVAFHVSNTYWGIHSLKAFDASHQITRMVEATRLDTYIQKHHLGQVDCIKIDAEGADFLVLQSIDFKKQSPRLIIVEFMDERSKKFFGYTREDMITYMAKYNYHAVVMEWSSLKSYSRKGVSEETAYFIGWHDGTYAKKIAWGNIFFVQKADEKILGQILKKSISKWQWAIAIYNKIRFSL